MHINELQKNWDLFGQIDPLWAILTAVDKKNNRWQVEEFFETGRKEIEEVMAHIESQGVSLLRRKALDFGCGVGRLTQALADYFDEIYGVDIAPSMIELANQYNYHSNKCKYILNETDNLIKFDSNYFDLVYTTLTLQHMEPRYIKKYLEELLRILAPQGLLIFQLPEKDFNKSILGNEFRNLIKCVLPKPLLTLYRKLKNKKRDEPVMEMYTIKQKQVIRWITKNKGKFLKAIHIESGLPGIIFTRYSVTKEYVS